MELDSLRRRSDDDKNHFRVKNNQFKNEIEELIKENKKLSSEKATLETRMKSLRQINKTLETRLEKAMAPLKQN